MSTVVLDFVIFVHLLFLLEDIEDVGLDLLIKFVRDAQLLGLLLFFLLFSLLVL